ncbi:hypothetical protein RD149_08065 [Gordonia westfalica]|uniref:Sap, sulfolipid-1-addressing protein n=1 Tax=Gordonia westfalica TaxID=158898 RepID=A0ABU2GQH3_9ACTN|nr:hypothetical protein [Gordonia westfalica]MDS1113721.1 hypothetical protein [Gordonia westfalica]
MTGVALVLLVLTAVAPVLWLGVEHLMRERALDGLTVPRSVRIVHAAGLTILLGLAAATAIVAATAGPATGFPAAAATVIAAVAAVTGGGPVVRAVLQLGGVRAAPTPPPDPENAPAPENPDPTGNQGPEPTDPTEVGPLRGGRVIGYLERLAVVTTLMAGWPEGLAIILAVKSLARYPELRAPQASEQFIMGTFASVLWAIGLAGIAHLITA